MAGCLSKAVHLLPIVQRELLIAAKSRRTFRLRMIFAVGATLLGLITVVGWTLRGGMRTGGDGLFGFLAALFWLVCCGSGIFLTADCLSREKREGTLGLLFLTDLRGVDIILGKLASTSLMTLLMVIGGIPVLALCVLMGGVSGGEFFRTCVALLLTMLFSLSVGMFVSTLVRDSGPAKGVTLLVLLATVLGVPALTNLVSLVSPRGSELVFPLNYLSPAYLIGSAKVAPAIPDRFLFAAGTMTLTSLGLLALSCWLVRHTWQDRPRRLSRRAAGHQNGSAAGRLKRDPLLDQHPVLWLTGGSRWHGWLAATAILLLLAGGWFAFPFFRGGLLEVLPEVNAYVLPYLFALTIAGSATAFFVRMRQENAFEFLLSTPLGDAEILRGQWIALRRRFLPPAVVLLALIWIPGTSYHEQRLIPDFPEMLHEEWVSRAYLTARAVLLWLAAGWMGMHFGLNIRRPQFAGLMAILVSVIIPWFLWCLPEVLVTLVLINMGRESLRGRVRQTILRHLEAGQPV